MKDVAILGCGPAGLLAAHAVEQAGLCPVIYSIPVKSPMSGAQYLHGSIPGLTPLDGDLSIRFIKLGTAEGYAQKVYGSKTAPTSWDLFPAGDVKGWALAPVYNRLWDRYRGELIEGPVTPRLLDGLEARYPLILSTIPAKALCENMNHKFEQTEVWIRSWKVGTAGLARANFIEYNGLSWNAYYRMSAINGQCSTEFGHWVADAAKGFKPIRTDCDCRPTIKRLGRFGQWRKGVLLHHAYYQALDALRLQSALL